MKRLKAIETTLLLPWYKSASSKARRGSSSDSQYSGSFLVSDNSNKESGKRQRSFYRVLVWERTQWEPCRQLILKSQSWWGRNAQVLPKLLGQPLSYLPQGLPIICFGSGSDKPPNNILSLANCWPDHGAHSKNGPLITSREKQTPLVFATLKSTGEKQVKSSLFSSFELPNILYFDYSKHFACFKT